jgi:copper resistance protein B
MSGSMVTWTLIMAVLLPAGVAGQHQHPPTPPPAQKPVEDHSAHMQKPAAQPKEPLPPITDADRAAAFPQNMEGHTVHDQKWMYHVLFDQVEWQGTNAGGVKLENTTWIGGDIDRLWLRFDAESDDGRMESVSAHALWGRSFSRWWDVVAGIRQDVRPGDPQTWAAVGIQGLAPYWFEVEATGYLGAGGRTRLNLEAEYDLLLTNRLVLQPVIEAEIYGKSDPERGIGAGLSSIESGLRLRYEIRREFAPYVGVTWHRSFFGTADHARAEGDDAGGARLAIGLRAWF